MNPNTEYLGDSCPSGIEQMEANANYYVYQGSTMSSMTWLNLLTNSILEPNLAKYPVQAGFSYYGELNFDSAEVSQGVANILTVIAMFLMNGFWPMAVWRLAHERAQDIVLMMRTVGMRAFSYVFGMFVFDMFVSVLSGVAMVCFAVSLKLSQFEGAPVGYLIAIVILSAWALNAGALLIVRVLGKRSSILPLAAPCVLIAATAGSSLTNILVYPDEGSWPWGLSIVPFFAQGRALYIVLVYHQTTPEVDTALALLFLFGLVCFALAYAYELDYPLLSRIWEFIHLRVIPWLRGPPSPSSPSSSSAPRDKSVLEPLLEPESSSAAAAREEDLPLDVENRRHSDRSAPLQDIAGLGGAPAASGFGMGFGMGYGMRDADVLQEKQTALAYRPTASEEEEVFAIVIQNLAKVYNSQLVAAGKEVVAVRELSLALRYGECFGLLGPNGAGRD
jgi:hypothetical protein